MSTWSCGAGSPARDVAWRVWAQTSPDVGVNRATLAPAAAGPADVGVEVGEGGVALGVEDGVHVAPGANRPSTANDLWAPTTSSIPGPASSGPAARPDRGSRAPPTPNIASYSRRRTTPETPSAAAPEPPHRSGVSPRDP